MAYYIFLKSLVILEEFRKNPYIKIPPKSPPTNFKSLDMFKNPIFIQKKKFLQLLAQLAQRPAGPSSLSADPAQPAIFFLLPLWIRARKLPLSVGLCHTLFRERGNKVSIRVPGCSNHTHGNNMINR
jgi:hypothetical protein